MPGPTLRRRGLLVALLAVVSVLLVLVARGVVREAESVGGSGQVPAGGAHETEPSSERARVRRGDVVAPDERVASDEDSRAPAPVEHVVVATVVDAKTGFPLPGAVVSGDWDREAVAGEDGRARLTRAPAGVVNVSATAEGYAGAFGVEVHTQDSGETPVRLELATGARLHGVVVDAATGLPVAGVRLHVRQGHQSFSLYGPTLAEATTAGDGRFEMHELPSVLQLWAAVTAEGYAYQALETWTARGRDEPLRIELQRASDLVGRVVDASGEPVAGAEVRVAPADDPKTIESARAGGLWMGGPPPWLQAETDDDGRFRVRDLLYGERYVAFAGTHATGPGELSAELDPATLPDEIVLALPPAARLVIELSDPEGIPPEGTAVRLGTRSWISRGAERDDAGRFVFAALAGGPQDVRVTAPGRLPVQLRPDVVPGEETVVRVQLERGLTVSGRVVDGDAQPFVGARVRARSGDAVQEVRTDAAGAFDIGGLPPGRVVVVASADGAADAVAREAAGTRDVVLTLLSRPVLLLRVRLPGGTESAAGHSVHEVYYGRGPPDPLTARYASAQPPRPLVFENGVAAIRWSIVPAHVRLRVVTEDFAPLLFATEPRAGETIDLGEVTLDAGRTLRGRVQDDDGRPVEGASVTAVSLLAGEPRAESGAGGAFALRRIGADRVRLRVEAPRHGVWERDVAVDRNGPAVVVTISRLPRVVVRVLGPDGAPDDAALVDCILMRGGEEGANMGLDVQQDGRGTRADWLPPAVYRIRFTDHPPFDSIPNPRRGPTLEVDATGDDPAPVTLRAY